MKKQIIVLGSVLLLGLSSCSDFLTDELKGAYDSTNFYTSPEQAIRAINGVYNSVSLSRDENRIWVFGDVASDDSEKGGNAGDQGEINFINDYTANADNGIINVYWQNLYESISRSNTVIANIKQMTNIDQVLKDRIVGEAKFLRAYNYFLLVNIFGEVPLKLYPQLTQETIHVPLSSVEKIYSQIEQDLSEAAPALPISYMVSSDMGRATRGAALGLLAKVQLFQQKWGNALQSITQLESFNQYDLVKDYSNLYKMGAEDSIETIFSIRHLSFQNPGVGNMLNQMFAPLAEGGYYFNTPTESYVNSFNEKTTTNEDDPRLDVSIGRAGKPWLNGDQFDAAWSPTGYLIKKHNQPLSEVAIGKKGDGGLAYLYLRYADVLLMKAEALNENGNAEESLSQATKALNRVRGRALLAPTIAQSQTDLREAIRLERRRELGFEFHRFFDVMRYGKEYAERSLGENFKWVEPRFYYPIPQAEKDANQSIN